MLEEMLKRRTIRKYKDIKVEKEKVETILKGALSAPSGRNLKPVDIIVVDDKEKLEKLGDARGAASQWMKNAPLGMVLIVKKDVAVTWVSDASIMATFIQLLASSEGLGSCWIHLNGRVADDGSDVENNVRKILDIPEDYTMLNMISIGYPDEDKSEHNVNLEEDKRVLYNNFNERY